MYRTYAHPELRETPSTDFHHPPTDRAGRVCSGGKMEKTSATARPALRICTRRAPISRRTPQCIIRHDVLTLLDKSRPVSWKALVARTDTYPFGHPHTVQGTLWTPWWGPLHKSYNASRVSRWQRPKASTVMYVCEVSSVSRYAHLSRRHRRRGRAGRGGGQRGVLLQPLRCSQQLPLAAVVHGAPSRPATLGRGGLLAAWLHGAKR